MALRPIQSVPSRNIASVEWDDETLDLVVTFRSGYVYRYDQVPEDVAEGFRTALSASDYLKIYVADATTYSRIL